MSDGTSFLLQRIAQLERENDRLTHKIWLQRKRAETWKHRAYNRSTVSLVCGCGRTIRGRATA